MPPSAVRHGGRRLLVQPRRAGAYAPPPAADVPPAGASSVFNRAAIASGFGRRFRRAGFFLRSPSASASTPVSVEYVVPSASSADSRIGIWRRASPITSDRDAVIRATERMASSLDRKSVV